MTYTNGEIIKKLRDWREFEQCVNEIYQRPGPNDDSGSPSSILFRGQAKSDWPLESTLDRFISRTKTTARVSVFDYYRVILAVYPAFASHTGLRFPLPEPGTSEYSEAFKRAPWQMPGYEFAIHLRHHGFPSPLLDWTKSPYIAAFFAFNTASQDGDVAIFSYQADIGTGKVGWSHTPKINDHGPYAITHDRHFRQQAEYTTCTIKEDVGLFYARHQDAKFGDDQDILIKIQLPSRERSHVMRKLDQMNINAFSLFGSQEGLADMLAYKELELYLKSPIGDQEIPRL